jgi:hypothetical protein
LVHEAFRNNPEDARQYLEKLEVSMNETAQAERKSMVALLVIAGAFELIRRAAVEEIQFMVIQVKDFSLIEKALPLLFAYYLYDIVILSIRLGYGLRAFFTVTELVYPGLRRTELDRLISPRPASLFGPVSTGAGRLLSHYMSIPGNLLRTTVFLLLIAAEAYMLYWLFRFSGSHDLVVWCVFALSVSLLAYAAAVYVSVRRTIS